MSEKPIKIGLLGCGEWGKHYLRVFSGVEGVEMKAVIDPSPGRRDFARSLVSGIDAYDSLDTFLEAGEKCDALVIATPATAHYAAVKKALLGGLDVLVEKPMTTSVKEAQELCDIAKEKSRILMVAHTFIYNSAVRALKALLDGDRLGKMYYMRACRTHLGLIREDVNVVWDLAAHDVSIFAYLLGMWPDRIQAMGRCILADNKEDACFITLGFPSGVVANVLLSWADANKARVVEVVGSKARIVFDDLNMQEPLRIFEKGVSIDTSGTPDFGKFKFYFRDGDIISPKIQIEEPLKTLRNEFIEALRTRTSPITDGVFGCEVVKVLCKVEEVLKAQR